MIFDVGVNAGEDTSFYLKKGFRVVGVEANPHIFAQLQATFAQAIADGSLTLLNVGIWNEASTLPFYVNLDNDHWSSFDPVYGCRGNTRYEIIDIPCVSIRTLIEQCGVPRYMKVDIEGGDKLVLADLSMLPKVPPFISVEEFGNQTIPDLFNAGYRRFKIVPQRTKELVPADKVQIEGMHVDRIFTGRDSGAFGLDLIGDWLDYDQALRMFRKYVRTASGESAGPADEWYDVHASLDESSITPSPPVLWLWQVARKQQARVEQEKQETNRQVSEALSQLRRADQELESIKCAFEEENRLRIDAEQRAESRGQKITDAEKRAEHQRQTITNAEQRAASLQQSIIDAEKRINDQDELLRMTYNELAEIRASRTWRLFGPYRSLRKRLSAR